MGLNLGLGIKRNWELTWIVEKGIWKSTAKSEDVAWSLGNFCED